MSKTSNKESINSKPVTCTDGVFSTTKNSITYEYNTCQGIDECDIQKLSCRTKDQDLKKLFKSTLFIGSDGSSVVDCKLPRKTGLKKVFLIYKKQKGKYYIVYGRATQTKGTHWGRVGIFTGIGAFTGGAISGTLLFIPGINIAVAPFILGGVLIGLSVGGVSARATIKTKQQIHFNDVMRHIKDEIANGKHSQLINL
ncbi:unnamed protein product [Adineta ricciae]|uniref:Uncharacterized protein n=1 Tax=Adineta ricciae TaxID=249248 RepID=A0A814QJX3_ADIRI|nr:unnamed protein product [Adineta ricciae]CAF1215964.1 unnamed protein product [Adineta ricciae]